MLVQRLSLSYVPSPLRTSPRSTPRLPLPPPPLPQTLNTGSLKWATALFFGYLYMVASWGGYSFIANLIPIHCLACIVFQRVSARLYIAYAPWVILGALAAGARQDLKGSEGGVWAGDGV